MTSRDLNSVLIRKPISDDWHAQKRFIDYEYQVPTKKNSAEGVQGQQAGKGKAAPDKANWTEALEAIVRDTTDN